MVLKDDNGYYVSNFKVPRRGSYYDENMKNIFPKSVRDEFNKIYYDGTSEKLEKELISRGATVYLTREEDNDLSARTSERKRSDLYNRAKYINTIKPNMYISIHLNATTSSSWKGLQVFYNKNNEENKVIAETITNNLKNNINNIREVKEENKYYMYKYIKYPGVLIEAGFISNPDENYLLRQEEYQNKLIILIADAIEKYYQK